MACNNSHSCNACGNARGYLTTNGIYFPDFVANSCCNPCCSNAVGGVSANGCGCHGCGCHSCGCGQTAGNNSGSNCTCGCDAYGCGCTCD